MRLYLQRGVAFGAWITAGAGALAAAEPFDETIRPLLETYCIRCHGGEKVKGKVDFSKVGGGDTAAHFELWEKAASVLRVGEMPPEDEEKQPTPEERRTILGWVQGVVEAPVEARPGVFRPRRLSGPEYSNTMRSLFGFELEVNISEAEQTVVEKSLVKKLLPTDPPGANGFVNDTHGAPLSTVLWDQYSLLADYTLNELFSKGRRRELGELIGEDELKAEFDGGQARALIGRFLPRAFRRPVPEEEVDKIAEAFTGLEGVALLEKVKSEMKVVLMSPAFLYRGLLMDRKEGRSPVDNYEFAERLSYFLWEDMPDAELTGLAAEGKLESAVVLEAQVDRMLASPKARSLAESFGVQWFSLDEIDDVTNEPTLKHAFKSQPVDFLNYLFTGSRPLIELIDSKTAFVNGLTAGFYDGKDRAQMERVVQPKGIEKMSLPNQRITLEATKGRGGLLTTPGVLMMNRGPILRGNWMLRNILGEDLGEPPPDVPPIQGSPKGKNLTFRQQFALHRDNSTCARCHDKIDPLGFAFEHYDARGTYFYKPEDLAKRRIDASGRMPDGETFENFEGLKQILLTGQRETVIRHFVERTLAYALARKLERADRPTVDVIADRMLKSNGTWRDLFVEIAKSLPFTEAEILSETGS